VTEGTRRADELSSVVIKERGVGEGGSIQEYVKLNLTYKAVKKGFGNREMKRVNGYPRDLERMGRGSASSGTAIPRTRLLLTASQRRGVTFTGMANTIPKRGVGIKRENTNFICNWSKGHRGGD